MQEQQITVPIGQAGPKSEAISELTQLHSLGFHCRERMEAAAANCARLLGVDPNADSIERDWANEIVFHGTPVDVVVDRIARLRQQKVSA